MVSKDNMNIIIGILLLGIGLIFGAAITNHNTPSDNVQDAMETPTPITTAEKIEAPTQDNIFNYCSWTYYTTPTIGEYHKAPSGYNYAVVTLNIKNTGTHTYSTNPFNWNFKVDGITYNHDDSTYDESIRHMNVEVGPGGNVTDQIVFLVKGDPTSVELVYSGSQ
jgi:hypothetical protein